MPPKRIGPSATDSRNSLEAIFITRTGQLACPLWVKSRHVRRKTACPLYPQSRPRKQTSAGGVRDSANDGVGKVGQFSRSRSLHEFVPQGFGYLQLDAGSPPPFVADIAPAGGRVTAAGDDLAVEPRGTELCVDQVPQLIIAPAHIDGLMATGKSMYGDDEIAHRDQSETFGLVELRGSYVKVGVGPRPQSLEII